MTWIEVEKLKVGSRVRWNDGTPGVVVKRLRHYIEIQFEDQDSIASLDTRDCQQLRPAED